MTQKETDRMVLYRLFAKLAVVAAFVLSFIVFVGFEYFGREPSIEQPAGSGCIRWSLGDVLLPSGEKVAEGRMRDLLSITGNNSCQNVIRLH